MTFTFIFLESKIIEGPFVKPSKLPEPTISKLHQLSAISRFVVSSLHISLEKIKHIKQVLIQYAYEKQCLIDYPYNRVQLTKLVAFKLSNIVSYCLAKYQFCSVFRNVVFPLI